MDETRQNARIFRKSFSKLCTTQKHTIHSSFVSWVFAEGRKHDTYDLYDINLLVIVKLRKLVPSSFRKHPTGKREVNCLFLCRT